MATAWSAASKAKLKSNLVRRDVSASEAQSWVVRAIARTITDGGMDGRPNPGAYRCAKSSSRTTSRGGAGPTAHKPEPDAEPRA